MNNKTTLVSEDRGRGYRRIHPLRFAFFYGSYSLQPHLISAIYRLLLVRRLLAGALTLK